MQTTDYANYLSNLNYGDDTKLSVSVLWLVTTATLFRLHREPIIKRSLYIENMVLLPRYFKMDSCYINF